MKKINNKKSGKENPTISELIDRIKEEVGKTFAGYWGSYQTREEQAFKNCWSLANLQPLEAKENLIKHNHFILQSQLGEGIKVGKL